jgi:HPt (histidine-containing phosphotransfer) domain-containing protein
MEKPARAELPPELARKLHALDQQFRAGLRQRLADVSGPDPVVVHAALHRLVGAAGAYGHTALAKQARQAMQAIEVGQTQWPTQTSALQAVTAEIERLMT